jgi:hypothetical protein
MYVILERERASYVDAYQYYANIFMLRISHYCINECSSLLLLAYNRILYANLIALLNLPDR